jgi:hypothetical protein
MNILRKHVGHLGFKGTHVMGGSFQSCWYRVFPKERVVIAIQNLSNAGVYRFDFTRAEMRRFLDGKLSLLPPGSCAPTAKEVKTDLKTIHEGEFKRVKTLYKVLHGTGLFPELAEKCKCGQNPAEPLHECPYNADVNNDPTPCCYCCHECSRECAEDI